MLRQTSSRLHPLPVTDVAGGDMEETLRKHQQDFVDNHIHKSRVLLYWDCRTGKSKAAELYIKERSGKTIAVVLKKNKKEWQQRLPDSRVFTKEEIKKEPLENLKDITAILIDECHFVAGTLFKQKTRSQLSERIYDILHQNPGTDLIMLSATPITNNYASLHTLMVFLDIAPTWKEYNNFMTDLVRNPFVPGRTVYMYQPKPDWRVRARSILDKYSDIFLRVRLEDCVESMPESINEVVKLTGAKKCDCEECHWTHDHKLEQKKKVKWILDNNFDKLIIAAHYREQIEEVSKALKKHRNVYTVYGGMTNQEEVIRAWQDDPFGYLVISASMGEGFDGYSADALVFLSMTHEVLAHTQMRERLTTLDNPKPRLYFYLLGGKWDKRIYETVAIAEKDFYGEDT